MLSTYHQFTLDEILYEIPLLDVYVLYSWAFFNAPIHQFNGIQMSNGYSAQEADRLMENMKKQETKI
jgi:hypothetical protein